LIKNFFTVCIIALSLASVSLSACDGKGKLVEDRSLTDISTK